MIEGQGESSHRLPENRLQRRITVAAFLMGLGIALWVVPVVCLAFDLPRGVFGLSTELVSSASILVFGLGIFYGYQKQTNDWLGRAEAESAQDRQMLRDEVAELRELVLTLSAALSERIDHVGVAVMQENFNAFGNGVTTVVGGSKAADETDTRRLPDVTNNIIPMPQHLARGNQRHNGHEPETGNTASHRRP